MKYEALISKSEIISKFKISKHENLFTIDDLEFVSFLEFRI